LLLCSSVSFFFLVLPTTTVSADNPCVWTGSDSDVPGADDTVVVNNVTLVVETAVANNGASKGTIVSGW
jgi:hypothetical protein